MQKQRHPRSRPLVYGFALATGVTLAVLWLSSSGCDGSLCLGAGDKLEGEATDHEASLRARVSTEDLERIWKEAESTRPEPETAPAGQDEAVPEVGQEVPVPVLAEQGAVTTAEIRPAEANEKLDTLEGGGSAFDLQEPAKVDPEVVEARAAAAYAAINEPNDELRAEAIGDVGLRRDGETVAVLTDVAFSDPVADNRYQALEQLWYSAADGLDGDGAITTALREALNDPDERIAELAEKALADLDRIEKRREQEEY